MLMATVPPVVCLSTERGSDRPVIDGRSDSRTLARHSLHIRVVAETTEPAFSG